MERDEVHGTWANWSTLKAIAGPWIEDRKIRILAQWALRKHPELPDVPLILDQAKTEEQKQSLDLALARLEFGRPFFMPPNVPTERVNAMRRAFDAAMKDRELLDEADKLKIEIDPLSGEQVAALIEQIYQTPAETVARVRDAMAPK
jgi:tripartite-type tricarboxylate transporter receptor subunit TctC